MIPTGHMGAAVTQMERRGIQTKIGNLNRDIKAANRMMTAIRSTIQNLRDWLNTIMEVRKELLSETKQEDISPNLANLLRDYLNLRKQSEVSGHIMISEKAMHKICRHSPERLLT